MWRASSRVRTTGATTATAAGSAGDSASALATVDRRRARSGREAARALARKRRNGSDGVSCTRCAARDITLRMAPAVDGTAAARQEGRTSGA